MHEAECAGVEHGAHGSDARSAMVAYVDLFPDQGMTQFRKVNANLMLTPRLQPAFDQRGANEVGDGPDVRHRPPRLLRRRGRSRPEVSVRAAQLVTTIPYQVRLDTRRRHDAVRDRMVNAIDGVIAKLCRQDAFGQRAAREYHEPRRILVESVNHAQRTIDIATTDASQNGSSVIDQRVLVPGRVGDRQHAGRLGDDHDVRVVEDDRALGEKVAAQFRPLLVDGDHCARRDAKRGVEAAFAVYGDAAIDTERAGPRPRQTGLVTDDGRESGFEPLPVRQCSASSDGKSLGEAGITAALRPG